MVGCLIPGHAADSGYALRNPGHTMVCHAMLIIMPCFAILCCDGCATAAQALPCY